MAFHPLFMALASLFQARQCAFREEKPMIGLIPYNNINMSIAKTTILLVFCLLHCVPQSTFHQLFFLLYVQKNVNVLFALVTGLVLIFSSSRIFCSARSKNTEHFPIYFNLQQINCLSFVLFT